MVAIITVGIGVNVGEYQKSVCLYKCLEAHLPPVDHKVSPAMFLPFNDGSDFRKCINLVTSLLLSRWEPNLCKLLY